MFQDTIAKSPDPWTAPEARQGLSPAPPSIPPPPTGQAPELQPHPPPPPSADAVGVPEQSHPKTEAQPEPRISTGQMANTQPEMATPVPMPQPGSQTANPQSAAAAAPQPKENPTQSAHSSADTAVAKKHQALAFPSLEVPPIQPWQMRLRLRRVMSDPALCPELEPASDASQAHTVPDDFKQEPRTHAAHLSSPTSLTGPFDEMSAAPNEATAVPRVPDQGVYSEDQMACGYQVPALPEGNLSSFVPLGPAGAAQPLQPSAT